MAKNKDVLLAKRKEGLKVEIDLEEANWWTREAVTLIEEAVPAAVLRGARSYVRTGRVLGVTIEPGVIEARVQGRRTQPYQARLYFALPSPEQLAEIRRRLSDRAVYGAHLLMGEMPPAMEDIFMASGCHLVSLGRGRERLLCSCPEPDDLCKHVVATMLAATFVFDRNPFLLLKLRGLPNNDLLAAILAPRNGAGSEECQEWDSLEGESSPLARGESLPLPPDASYYGGESVRDALVSLAQEGNPPADTPATPLPLFDFPLWRGEESFRDSIDPYYESVRKLLRNK